jgi:Golgi SNAP receptor complex protein 1
VDALSRAEEGSSPSLWDEESALQPELARLIQRLQDLISSRLAASATTSSQQASVKRYREIVLDLRADFDKSVVSVRRAKERRELLGSSSVAAASGAAAGGGADPAMEHLLRERNHIQNSMNAAASVIGQADAVRQDLYGQGRSLRGTGALMAQLSSNIPGLNSLVDQIRRRRSRDDKILAGVIASCIVFTLWYVLG